MIKSIWTCDLCQKEAHQDWLGKPTDWQFIKVTFGSYARTGYACHQCTNASVPPQGFIKYWRQVVAFLTGKQRGEG